TRNAAPGRPSGTRKHPHPPPIRGRRAAGKTNTRRTPRVVRRLVNLEKLFAQDFFRSLVHVREFCSFQPAQSLDLQDPYLCRQRVPCRVRVEAVGGPERGVEGRAVLTCAGEAAGGGSGT